jgi:neutral amino acid transport system substrate-binding protein
VGLLAGACNAGGGGGTADGAGGSGLKIGALLPATGDLSSIGQPMLTVVPLLVETVNGCGGVNGQPVTLVTEDDQTDPTAGAEAMSKLAEVDRVAGVVGSFASSVSQAAVDIAVRNRVMLISPGSTSPEFTKRAQNGDFNGYWARTAPPDTYQAQALAKLAREKGFTTASTVVINNDYGVGFEQEFDQSFAKLGGKVINQKNPTRYDPKAPTLATEAAAAFAGNPEAVAAVLYAETGSLLLQSAYEQGLLQGKQILLTDGVYSDDFPQQVGKTRDGKYILSGAIGTVPGANGPALAEFTQFWKSETNKPVSAYVPHTWDAAALLALAAQAAGNNTGEGIQEKIREVSNAPGTEVTDVCEGLKLLQEGQEINFQGASGDVDIDEQGDVVGSYDVWTVKDNGELAVTGKVDPE